MQLPAPDTGLSSFPVSDSATVSMPGPDSGAITFPPAPIPIVVITAVTIVDVETSVETRTVPWYVVETVVDVATGADVLASVTVEAETTVDAETTVIQIFDSVTAETVVDVATSVTAIVSTAVAAETIVDVVTEALLGTQRAIATANTTVDVESEVISIPVTSFTANTTVVVTTSATVAPASVVTAETIVDVQTSGTIVSFTPMGMLKSGPLSTPASNTRLQVTGWAQDPAYPGSVVTSDALVINGTKTATVAAAVVWQDRWFATSYVVEIRKNGVLIPGATISGTGPSSGTGMSLTVPVTSVAVASGDQITLWASGSGFSNTILAAGTYLRIS
ncbi:hypothetical protein EU244_026345 [Rhodococcus qingshengii]|uniref:hypothetical protein n=1 Tax=Rhodococcus qingshengii TaxID=334542 RepID=UPI0010A63515|nr:hypothetical protein [Rhodococcus qingshengii]THJ69110.1 hypothetical protein EU244_22470 [Rhodococcus qingshengii]